MNLTTCKLYNIKRKRDLFSLLRVKNYKDIKEVCNLYTPYIADKGKKRLIEPVSSIYLQKIQKRIQILLKDIYFDENIFSGISGRSYIDNGKLHLGCKYVLALDISKFFPNTNREKVYNFFKYDMGNSSDVAKILTDLCTINLKKIKYIKEEVFEYIEESKIRFYNHISTGSSISCILSYLVNYKMFDKIIELGKEYNCMVSIYVDDIVVSSKDKINQQFINKVISIIKSNGYKIQKSKLKIYDEKEFKRVTGNILSKDGTRLIIPNKIRYRLRKLKKNREMSMEVKNAKIKGYNQVIKQIKSE